MRRACTNLAVDGLRRVSPVDASIFHGDFMRVFQTLGGLWCEYGSAITHGGQSVHIHGRALFRQSCEQLARSLPTSQLDRQRGDDWPIIQTFSDLEYIGTSGRIAVPNCTLGGGSAAPLRQVGEVQVVPAHRHGIQHGLRQDIAISDDGGDIRMQPLQGLHELGGARLGVNHGQTKLHGCGFDRARRELSTTASRRVRTGDDADDLKTRVGGERLK